MTVEELKDAIANVAEEREVCQGWKAQLVLWLGPLSTELLALPDRIRDSHTLGVKRNLELSLHVLYRGTDILQDTGYDLTNLRLGELMRKSGFEPIGSDPSRNYSGVMPWFGSEKEIDKRIADLTKRHDELHAKLAEATLSDADRATRDAENAAYRDTVNSMRITGSDDGRYLVAKARDGRELDVSELTPEQRKALQRANSEHASGGRG